MLNKKYLEIVKKPEELFDLLLAKSKNIKAKTKGEIFGRGVAIFASFAGKFTSFVTRHALFDNKIIDKFNQLISDMKKSDSTSKIKQKLRGFVKNNPTFFAVFFYWLILTAGIGGIKLSTNKDNNIKSNIESFINKQKNKKTSPKEFLEPEYINPNDFSSKSEYVSKAIEAYYNDILIGLAELETYEPQPKRHGSEKRLTYFFGVTWVYEYDTYGVLQQYECLGKYAEKVRNMSIADKEQQLKYHLQQETIRKLYNLSTNKRNFDYNVAIALCLAGYQIPGQMSGIANRIDKAKNKQQIADAFMYYSGNPKFKVGTLKRRWVCAALAIGAISIDDLLNMSTDAFSTVNYNTIVRGGHFQFDRVTIEHVLSRKRGKLVKDFLNEKGISVQQPTLNFEEIKKKQEEKSDVMSTDVLSVKILNEADAEYNKGNYTKAKSLYEQAIEKDADNMEAYSSLSITYKHLGDNETDINKKIEYYNKCCETVSKCNKRMNKNRNLLEDKDIKANTYYNAGLAREELGKIYKNKKDYPEAQRQLNLAKQNYITADENNESSKDSVYNPAIERVENLLKTVKLNIGQQKVKKSSGTPNNKKQKNR